MKSRIAGAFWLLVVAKMANHGKPWQGNDGVSSHEMVLLGTGWNEWNDMARNGTMTGKQGAPFRRGKRGTNRISAY